MKNHEMCCGTTCDKQQTIDLINAQQRRIGDLLKERDELCAFNFSITVDNDELRQERDELAAMVDRLREHIHSSWTALCMVRPSNFPGDLAGLRSELDFALTETPSAAIEALKAKWQAEAVRVALSLDTHIDRLMYEKQLIERAREASDEQ